jgi:hypothetical protein
MVNGAQVVWPENLILITERGAVTLWRLTCG